jgi:hypothetical protein
VRAVCVLEQAASSRTPGGSGGSADTDDCEVEDEPRAYDDRGEGRARRRCKSAYLHIRRHLYCLVRTRAATPVTTPVLPCQDACSDTSI